MCVESIERQRILPSPNHAVRAPDTANVAVTVTAAPHRVESVLKLSLGFGGHLAAVVLTAG
jgi:3-oxoacyl-(acyl-carrier-protein) synthase